MKTMIIRSIIRSLAALLLLSLTVSMAACKGAETELDTTAPTAPTAGETTQSPEDESALDFTVTDGEGKQVRLSDFFGKPIVLNFWASWCPPCKAELPDFEDAYKQYEGKVTFLMVNVTDNQRETVEVAKSYVSSQGYTFPVYFDTGYEASYKFGISSIPQTFFLNADGQVVAKATGLISASQLEEGIGMIYSE